MKKTRMVRTALWMALTSILGMEAEAATRITKIEFSGKTDPHQIMITGDGPIEFEKIDNPADNQIILELKNASLANANVGRRIDASSFNSKVSLISPYNVQDQNAVRVIVQLREGADTPAVTAGNKLFVGIDGQPDPAVMAAVSEMDAGAAPAVPSSPSQETAGAEPASEMRSDGMIANYGLPSGKGTDGRTGADRVAQLTEARQTRKYVGSRITIQVKEAAISDVFRLIGEASGFNILLGSDVTGKITLSLVDVPWDLALDTILSSMKLGAERRGNVLRVATLATLTQEKQLEQTAKQAAENAAPRVTRIIPINYASPQGLLPILKKFGAGSAGSGAGPAQGRDTIELDERTNSFVIQDIPENIERMTKMIELLDRPTPQVLIESKIIEATEEFSKGIGGSLALAKETPGNNYMGVSAANGSLAPLTSNPFPAQDTLTAADNLFAAGFSLSRITNGRLRALLSFSESESKSKIISSPRTLVLNRQAATILQGTPVLVPITVVDAESGLPRQSQVVQSANLSLAVTPTVTNDGNIIMDLNVNSDTPQSVGGGQSGIGTRNIKTQVVAESGTTLVIGGVYQTRENKGESGFPGLRKIPIIGRFFGNEVETNNRSELLIFVSPKIVNEDQVAPGTEPATPVAAPSGLDGLQPEGVPEAV